MATPNKVKSTQQEITYLDVHMSETINLNAVNLRTIYEFGISRVRSVKLIVAP